MVTVRPESFGHANKHMLQDTKEIFLNSKEHKREGRADWFWTGCTVKYTQCSTERTVAWRVVDCLQIMRSDTSMDSLNVTRSESVTDLNTELNGLLHSRRASASHARNDENFVSAPVKPFGIGKQTFRSRFRYSTIFPVKHFQQTTDIRRIIRSMIS